MNEHFEARKSSNLCSMSSDIAWITRKKRIRDLFSDQIFLFIPTLVFIILLHDVKVLTTKWMCENFVRDLFRFSAHLNITNFHLIFFLNCPKNYFRIKFYSTEDPLNLENTSTANTLWFVILKKVFNSLFVMKIRGNLCGTTLTMLSYQILKKYIIFYWLTHN